MSSTLRGAVTGMRPKVEPLDHDWSASTLQRILGDGTPAPRRRRRYRIAAGTAAAVVLTGGVAYATGLVPDFVRAGFDDVSTADITNQRFVADFVAPDGRRIGIWFAANGDGLLCEAIVEDLDRDEAERGSLYSCGYRQQSTANFGWTTGGPGVDSTLYLYGERSNPQTSAVHAAGQGYDITIAIDPETGGWAQAVPQFPAKPEDTQRTVANLEFLDANGKIINSMVLKEK